MISICIANGNDRKRLMMTLHALRLFQQGMRGKLQLVVCDNTPKLPDAKWLKEDLQQIRAVYVPLENPLSANAAKNAAIAAATGDIVLCLDSHVYLTYPDALLRLDRFFRLNPDTLDLYTGPLLHTDLIGLTTHLNDEFRGANWGTAASAWESPGGARFSVVERDGQCHYRAITPAVNGQLATAECPDCPELEYKGHGAALVKLGFKRLGSKAADMLEVPGAYSGLFACRREAWLPFADGMDGHGGGDFALHHRYRLAGRRAWSLGFLQWWHYFDRKGETPRTPGRTIDKAIRNLLLNRADPVRVKGHYVGAGLITEDEFELVQRGALDHGSFAPHDGPPSKQTPGKNREHGHLSAGERSEPTMSGHRPPPAIPPGKPGSETKAIVEAFGIKACMPCMQLSQAMDVLGVDGCRAAKKELAAKMRANSKNVSWLDWAKAAPKALAAGYTSLESIIEEGCNRAESKLQAVQQPARAG